MSESHLSGTEKPDEINRLERNSFLIGIVATIVTGLATVGAFILEFTSPWTVLPIFLACILALRLIRTGRFLTGNWLLISVSIIASIFEVLQRSGEGASRGAIILVFIGSIALASMPPSRKGRTLLVSLLAGTSILMVDIAGPVGRLQVPQPPLRTILTLIVVIIFLYFIIRELSSLDLRTKITFGILGTGGIAIGVLSFFALNQAVQLANLFSGRFEATVNELAKEQLLGTLTKEANRADNEFSTTIAQVQNLANQLGLLQQKKNILGKGEYWNAEEKMIQLSNGQYTNTLSSPSSVFVPSFIRLDKNIIEELNTNVYLDFSVPLVIKTNPQIRAVYYTDPKGVIIYYPNVWFSANVPYDYDGTKQPSFRIASPLYDPEREPRWTFPRRDPAGVGLIISASEPVYFGDEFNGVMTVDFRLNSIVQNIKSIKVGDTGYAFLIDSDGHIIAMPPQGYELFGIVPEVLDVNQQPTQTIFDGNAPFELQQITTRMVVGGSGTISTNVNGKVISIAYVPIADNNFSLGVIVPSEELTRPFTAARQEVNAQIQNALRNATIILTVLLIMAISFSLGLGNLIAAPIRRLTQTANQILEGDLGAQASITSKDETGTLAQAFNAMTGRLRETLAGLENTIDERTAELVKANQANQRRAKQFQSIAQIARAISSTLDLDSLLNQITTTISREFGFYHVGVFLLDTAGEYAVLSAANSEGGQIMLLRGHRLKVGEKGLVGFASSTGRPRVALDTGSDAVFFSNPDLPDTRSEVALPMRAGEAVIGVLDVQSREPNAFSQDDVVILSTLADQVSIAIQNARQNEATQKALAESKVLSGQFIQSSWSQFTKKQNLLGVRHTGARAAILYSKKGKGKDDTLQLTGQLKPKGRGAVLSLPIKLRGQVIGSVDVRAPDNRRWDQEELEIVTAIIERAAVAMENARLLNESQRLAAKERTIGEITTKISAQSEVDALLKTAAQELNRTLPGTVIAIQFTKDGAE